MRYFIHLCFDGTNYHGWQRQDNAHTVQASLETALSTLLNEQTGVTGCGRTDTGVHARSYYAHLETTSLQRIKDPVKAINTLLPDDIVVRNVFDVDNRAHARYSAISRRYCYQITREKSPFLVNRAWHFSRPVDINLMNDAAAMMYGERDFRCFCKSGGQNTTTLCHLFEAHWHPEGKMLVFKVIANRFLRNMVRAMVGTLLDVGLGKMTKEDFTTLLENGSRNDAGVSVPACGLYLDEVRYPDGLLKV